LAALAAFELQELTASGVRSDRRRVKRSTPLLAPKAKRPGVVSVAGSVCVLCWRLTGEPAVHPSPAFYAADWRGFMVPVSALAVGGLVLRASACRLSSGMAIGLPLARAAVKKRDNGCSGKLGLRVLAFWRWKPRAPSLSDGWILVKGTVDFWG